MPRSLVYLLLFASCDLTPPVETTSGPELGHVNDGVTGWLGIRYAEPPTGERRFAAPVLRAKQTAEHDASSYGASCEKEEDCLFLNVWAPVSADKLPVMVFIHGGAYTMGSGGSASTLAKKGNVVTVTLNYRLGVFGFMAQRDLAAEAGNVAGNYGLLDQQLAISWVRQNIAAFGGDATNVTIFGESAGAGSVCSHLASPRAKGLFERALAESGSCVLPFIARERALVTGDHVASTVGCTTDVAKCLRAATADSLRNALATKLTFDASADHWAPIADGDVLPLDVYGAFARGEVAQVPFLSGANGNEGSLFTIGMKMDTRAEFEDFVRQAVPTHADQALMIYSEAAYPTPRDAATAVISDAFVCGQRKQAALFAGSVKATYLYHFTRANPGIAWAVGSTHGSEVPYVFGELGFPLWNTAEDSKLSDEMIGYWTRFARTGDPNGDGAAVWPAYGAEGNYMILDTTLSSSTGLEAARCDVLEAWLPAL